MRALWNHQRHALDFAIERGHAMLAMDMGTGKTRVAIEYARWMHCQKILVICPKKVITVWPKEIDRAGFDCWMAPCDKGSAKAKAQRIADALHTGALTRTPAVAIVNYESAWQPEISKLLLNTQWDLVILDESHRIKAPGGRASMFCRTLSKRATYRLCLTGTPMPHTPLDVYGQYRFLDPDIFGTSFARFRAKYAMMGGWMGREITGFMNEDDLNQRFYSRAFRVMADDVLDLPPLHEFERTTQFEPEAQRTYDQMEYGFITEIENGTVTTGNALTKLLRLAQCANGVIKNDNAENVSISKAKRELLAEVLSELPNDESVVVFGRFHTDLDCVHDVARELGRVSGELSGRRDDLSEFQRGGFPVIAVQIQAGGTGVDLTRARYAVYYSVNFSLGDYDQSRKRLHRPGQTRPVTYVHLVVEGTVDNTVYAALRDRKEIVEAILERGKSQ